MRRKIGMLVLASAALAASLLQAQVAPPAQSAAAPDASTDEASKALFFGKRFFDLKDFASAYEQFAKADSLKPDQPPVLYNMAVVLAKAGRWSEAQKKVDRYLQLYPGGAERPLVAKLQLELEFQRELQKKRQADQDYADLFSRGRFLYAKNDLDGALKLYQQAEQQRPSDPAAVFDEGVVYEKIGDISKATERFHRYAELETNADLKTGIDQRIFTLETELEDMKTKILCSFCGLRLPIGATWCPRCWHGPYVTSSVWSSRPCVEGASATRATYFSEDRFQKNESLPCLYPAGLMTDTLRYTPARQRGIQEARKAEGWTYSGEIIQGWSDKQGNQIKYAQGPGCLEKIASPSSGDALIYAAHKLAEGMWLLDREDYVIDGQKYVSHYTFDAVGRISEQQVDYETSSACGHLIRMKAELTYQNDALAGVKIHGGYEGYAAEGTPRVDWDVAITYTYDTARRLTKEELALTSFSKTYNTRPIGAMRDEVAKLYPSMRVRKPLENAIRTGDRCGMTGDLLLGNPIDLRPFYAITPNLAMVVPYGVVKAVVTFTYPDSFNPRAQ
ncbi:MAG TPA: tetratricopeptide repeat protein [Thermoanaerobaculia bacterium]|nr:tetratricopeptide repeat protein [Thermoanaerobaculia bacterium]